MEEYPMHRHASIAGLTFAGLLAFAATVAGEDDLRTRAKALFGSLPKDMATHPLKPEQVALGRVLYFESRVSADGTVSCARCHQPALYGTDALAKPIGVGHRVNPRNAPTVLNAALQIAQHWRGDRTSVEDQATKALTGPASYGNPTQEAAMAKLRSIPGYREPFNKAFPGQADPITAENWGIAIGAYERTLVTPSPFDAWLAGEDGALSPAARAGLEAFVDSGCAGCHGGVGVGGGMYQKFGLAEEYWKATGTLEVDKGRAEVTKSASDDYVFKVPSLRNVAMTPPYFHDGSVASLPQAVRIMARVQAGKTLTDDAVKNIVAFLESLTGALPADFATEPVLPAAAFEAPRSQPESAAGAPVGSPQK
jgi:cytochrome c peroxidase